MSTSHPLAAQVVPYCRKFPDQAGPLFQAFLDLSLAQGWKDAEVLELEGCKWAVIRGVPKTKSVAAFVLPIALTSPTSVAEFKTLFSSLALLSPSTRPTLGSFLSQAFTSPPAAHIPAAQTEPSPTTPPTVYLAVVEKDSSVVYYVLREGIVSPKEVPE